eukprot:COSAG05_NODE_105_length_18793_cov_115.346421_29_plen_248_part_00
MLKAHGGEAMRTPGLFGTGGGLKTKFGLGTWSTLCLSVWLAVSVSLSLCLSLSLSLSLSVFLSVLRARRVCVEHTRTRTGGWYAHSVIRAGALRRGLAGLNGVENVYTQHKPLLVRTISAAASPRTTGASSLCSAAQLRGVRLCVLPQARTLEELFSRGGLRESTHPVLQSGGRRGGAGAAGAGAADGAPVERVREALVFIVGGATYAEALVVAQHNAAHPDAPVVLGANELVNASTFLRDLSDTRR